MKYLYFTGMGNLAILLSVLTENIFNKFSLLGLGAIWIIASWFIFKGDMKLLDLKFKVKMLDSDLQFRRFEKITSLLESILKEIKDNGGKNGKNRSKKDKWKD